MSEKDRFDWNDDVEFNAETDAMEDVGCFESSLEGFEDYDDMSDDEEAGSFDTPADDAWGAMAQDDARQAAPAAEAADDPPNQAPGGKSGSEADAKARRHRAKVTVQRRSGLSAVGMGLLFAASILVTGIGVGGALLFAEGVDPVSLWQPQNLLQVDQLLNFSEYPLNMVYMVLLGITLLALLGSYRMGRLAKQSNARTRAAEEMLDKVCALRFDEQEAWRDEAFKTFPPAEEFVIKTLGAWRLQEARQKRLLGVESEIHRLEKALAGGERSHLTGRYDSPAIGRLVDEMLRHFDAREAAMAKAKAAEERDEAAGRDVGQTLREAQEWNWSVRDRMDEVGHELARLEVTLTRLAQEAGGDGAGSPGADGLADVVAGVRRDLATLEKTLAAGGPDNQATDELNDLVDRGSKLAFQIAMEVTRLGPRGDRLTPMSQSLEDLTTAIRKAVDGLPAMADTGQDGRTESISAKLDTLEELLQATPRGAAARLAGPVAQTAPFAARLAGELDELAGDFDSQADRLNTAGLMVGDLAGCTFEPTDAPDRTEQADEAEPLEIQWHDGPGEPDAVHSPGGFEVERGSGFTLGSEPIAEAPLSESPDEVYDLGSFGAAQLSDDSPADESADEVFELDTFGATPVDAGGADGPDEEIFDLDQFGAAPVEAANPADESDDEVFELDTFGATPMTGDAEEEPVFEMADLGGSIAEDAQGADEVMSLDAFGAVPLEDPADEPQAGDVFDLDDFGARPLD